MARPRINEGQSIQGFNKQLKKDLEEIFKALDQLPKEFSLTVRRNISKKAVAPFLRQAFQNAPHDTGDLQFSIGTKTFRNNKAAIFAGVILKKKLNFGGTIGTDKTDVFYAKFIEFGYTHIAWPKKGETIRNGRKGLFLIRDLSKKRLKKIPPRPFLRPAWNSTKDQCAKAMANETERRLKIYNRKVRKK